MSVGLTTKVRGLQGLLPDLEMAVLVTQAQGTEAQVELELLGPDIVLVSSRQFHLDNLDLVASLAITRALSTTLIINISPASPLERSLRLFL